MENDERNMALFFVSTIYILLISYPIFFPFFEELWVTWDFLWKGSFSMKKERVCKELRRNASLRGYIFQTGRTFELEKAEETLNP